MRLTPIDVNSPQEQLQEALAKLLCAEGVPDMFSGSLAIMIMGGIQDFLDGKFEETISFWNEGRH